MPSRLGNIAGKALGGGAGKGAGGLMKKAGPPAVKGGKTSAPTMSTKKTMGSKKGY